MNIKWFKILKNLKYIYCTVFIKLKYIVSLLKINYSYLIKYLLFIELISKVNLKFWIISFFVYILFIYLLL